MRIEVSKKIFETVALVAVICTICVFFPRSVNAEYQGWGTDSCVVCYYTPSYNSTWSAPLNLAQSEWNSPNCGVGIGSTNSTTGSTLTVTYSSESWYGITTQLVASPFKFTIVLNTRTINADATNFSNFVRSVTVHELGHVLWLKDNPNTTRASIMKYSRPRNTMVSEQGYDSEDVDAIF